MLKFPICIDILLIWYDCRQDSDSDSQADTDNDVSLSRDVIQSSQIQLHVPSDKGFKYKFVS